MAVFTACIPYSFNIIGFMLLVYKSMFYDNDMDDNLLQEGLDGPRPLT